MCVCDCCGAVTTSRDGSGGALHNVSSFVKVAGTVC